MPDRFKLDENLPREAEAFLIVRCLLMFALLFSSGLVWAASDQPTPGAGEQSEAKHSQPTKQEPRPATNQRGSESVPPVAKVIPPQDAQPKPDGTPYKHVHEPHPDWWTIVPTILLAFFTLGLFIYTARLWGATGELVREAKDTARKELRAYVCMAELKVIGPTEVVSERRLSVRMRNLGKTPSINTTIRATITIAEPLHEIDDPGKPVSFGLNPQMIYPGKSYDTKFLLDKDILLAVFGMRPFYVYGHIDYEDIFLECWRTRFCWEFNPADQEFYPYKKYNDEKPLGKRPS